MAQDSDNATNGVDVTRDPVIRIKKDGLREVFIDEFGKITVKKMTQALGRPPTYKEWANSEMDYEAAAEAHLRAMEIQDVFVDVMDV